MDTVIKLEDLVEILLAKCRKLYGVHVTKRWAEMFAKNMAYNCKMYWQQRTDIIHPDDYELYRQLTNNFAGLEQEYWVTNDFIPEFGNGILFLSTHSHSEMEKNIIEGITHIIINSTLEVNAGGLRKFITH